MIETLGPGETHRRPIRSEFGWHVIRLHRRIEGQVLPFEAVRGKIAEMLAARSWTVAATRYVADLAARSEIEGDRGRARAGGGGALMPMLGDILAAARDASGDFARWLRAVDPDLADEIAAAADREVTTPTAFVRVAVADFSRFAFEEDWSTLVSRMRDSEDPGTACLIVMVRWRLAAAAEPAAEPAAL